MDPATFRADAANGDLEGLQRKLPLVSSVDVLDKLSGCSAVMMAASRNRLECMLFLIAQGADWRRRSHLGRTALMQSAFWGATECCIHLVSLGGDPLELDKSGKSSIDIARERGYYALAEKLETASVEWRMKQHGNTAGVKLLRGMADRANAERQAKSQQLILACRGGNMGAVLRIVSNLRALDLSAKDRHGKTAMDYARQRGDVDILAVLNDANAIGTKAQFAHDAAGVKSNPIAYTRDGGGYLDDVLRRNGKVRLRAAPKRPWLTPDPSKVTVFGADKLFYKDAIAVASDGVIGVRGLPSNDLLFNFDEVPAPPPTTIVKAARRLAKRDEAEQADRDDDDGSVHSNADSEREELNMRLPDGHSRWLSSPIGKHTRAELGLPHDPSDDYQPTEHAKHKLGTRTHALKSWMTQNHIGGYYPRLTRCGVACVDDLPFADEYMLALDSDLVEYRKIRSNALSKQEKAKIGQLSGSRPRPPKRAPPKALPHPDAPKPPEYILKDQVKQERIISNVVRKAVFGLPKLVYDDELEDPVMDDLEEL